MFGSSPFACIYFAESFPFVGANSDANTPAPAGRPGGKKKKYSNWDAMIWPGEMTPEIEDTPKPKPVVVASSPAVAEKAPRLEAIPSEAMVTAVARPTVSAETRRKILAIQERIRQEIDDEETLLLLGAFD